MKLTLLPWLLISSCLLASSTHATHTEYFDELIKPPKSDNPPNGDAWPDFDVDSSEYIPVYIGSQDGLMEANKIDSLPGQPEGVDFDQYSGYVTVDPKAGRALFYYFAESPENSSTNPLVLWLNGGPGCSSLIGAMQELGPFRVNSDGKTLYRNPYAWNNVANVLFLESPAGVGFSYSNTSSDYDNCGDKNTAKDAYVFLVNWLERFPQYKTRDFFITGESYAGHYIPQLSYTILLNNEITTQTTIKLQGVAMGNALINEYDNRIGQYEYFWTHALISDETHLAIQKHCIPDFSSDECDDAQNKTDTEMGELDIYNIYAPLCTLDRKINNHTKGSVQHFDPCTLDFVHDYLNLVEVQNAFHANPTSWYSCSWPGKITWNDRPDTILPTIKQLMTSNISIWLYSGDMDGRVPVTSTRYSINSMNLPIKTSWYPWYNYHYHPHQHPTYTNEEVGGYAVEYEGLVFATVRGAGHLVPSYQPERALRLIKAFISGKLPPARFVR